MYLLYIRPDVGARAEDKREPKSVGFLLGGP